MTLGRYALVATLTVVLLPCVQAAPMQDAVNRSEWGIRSAATTAPKPDYPVASLTTKGAGVVVASVRFDLDGKVGALDILESPDPYTAAAVRDALARWVVPPAQLLGRETKSPIRGKLTFYFQVRDGKGVVLDPDEMPGGPARPKPRPPQSAPPQGPPPAPPAVRAGGHATAKTITVEEFKKRSGKAIVLDVGEREAFKRGHWPGAVNIPADELQIRGGPELPRDGTIVIDCTQEQNFRCAAASSFLLEQGFPSVIVMVR
jgi:rhodanese-related sulfurtransferase